MNTLPTKTSAVTSTPTLLPPQIGHNLRVLVSRLDPPLQAGRTSYEIAAIDAPSDELRQSLEVRRARIDGWMQPAGFEVTAEEGRKLKAVLKMRDSEPEAARRFAAVFTQDLLDLPAFALVGACSDLRRGIVGDGVWMPEPGVVRTVAQRKVAELARERREIDAVLSAKVHHVDPGAARKARVLENARGLVRQMPLNARRRDAERQGLSPEVELPPSLQQGHDEPLAAYQERMLRHAREVSSKPTPQLGPGLRDLLRQQGEIRAPLSRPAPEPDPIDEGHGEPADWRSEVA